MVTIHVDLSTVFIWAVVDLVAGFLASRAILGHGLGVVGMLGGLVGGFLAKHFGVSAVVSGVPIVSQIVVAFFGALPLLLLLRLVGVGRGRRVV